MKPGRSTEILLILLLILSACSPRAMHREIVPADEYSTLDKNSAYLKAHTPDGHLYVLEHWSVDEAARIVHGQGALLDAARNVVDEGTFEVPVDSVAVFETNVTSTSSVIVPLTVVTAASLALSAICAANPKACFGSCPTFYASNGDSLLLQAEGFSASIAPPLEASDLDALYRAVPQEGRVEIEMRNEALETHVVRYVNLIAAAHADGERVLKGPDDRLWTVRRFVPPTASVGPEGDCRDAVAAFDGVERFSAADSTDLMARETIDLTFDDVPGGDLGIVVASRHTLMSTFILYETFANMGTEFGRWLTMIENKPEHARKLLASLGDIDVYVFEDEEWKHAGAVGEHGPLATDVTVLPIDRPRVEEPLRVRLSMTKGNWRIDRVSLAALSGNVEAQRLDPEVVISQATGRPDDDALVALLDPEASLSTLPGDTYTLVFDLPGDGEYEIFLESRGYYLEWMRHEWLRDENEGFASQMIFATADAMKRLAPEFKKVEAGMEDAFWRSRFAKP